MKTKCYDLYKFEEMDEKGQEKAMDANRYINVDEEWWDFMYGDCETISAKISGFDIDRGGYCGFEFTESAETTARAILENHGSECDTYKAAALFIKQYEEIESMDEGNERDLQHEILENEFRREMAEEYLSMLRKEYEYLTSDEAVKETLIANDYHFNQKGEIEA